MSFNPLPLLISAAGVYFMFKLRFFFILHPIDTAKRSLRALKDKRALRSFSLALAGTLGVGNVFGVAFGIMVGGAGSVFWLLVSMLFSMIIKYAEVVISADSLRHDTDSHGGMFFVISDSFKRKGGVLSKLYAFGALALSLLMGAALQCNAVVSSVTEIYDVPRISIAIVLLIITFAAIVGGVNKIEKITAILIPMTTLIYIVGAIYIIFNNITLLPNVVEKIFSSAFKAQSAIGGFIGFILSPSFSEGFARGILSNEAGAGTSSMAHARNGVLNPASSGLLGMLEVWFDTGFLCMLTAFSILLTVPEALTFDNGMQLVMYAVGSTFGNLGKWCAALCVISFAFATVICWYYYGMESWGYVFGKRGRFVFLPIFLLFIFIGCYIGSVAMVFLVDIFMALISALCISALIKNSDRIKTLSEKGGVIKSDPSRRYIGKIKGSVLRREGKHRER